MQLRPWFVVSLTLNVGLLLALVWTLREKRAATVSNTSSLSSGTVARSMVPRPEATSQDQSLIGIRDALRATGVAPEQIEQVLRGALQKQRQRAKRASSWWKGTPYGGDLQFADPMEMHRDQQELRQLVDESALMAGSLGELDLGYIPETKRAAVTRILQDYAEVNAGHTANGLRFSADMAREDLLRAELQRDLRAVLTEKEYFEYTLHDSQSTEWVRLRMDAVSLGLTELEFRETAQALLAARALADPQARSNAVEQIHADLRARVGPDRVFEVRAKNSSEFYQLREAQVRFGFPQAATDRVVETWHRTAQAAEALRAQAADEATRTAAWRALAADTRKEVVAALGPEAGAAYLEQSMSWLREWENGTDTRMSGGMMGKR
ncbi:MAG: hypothetical protein JF599_05360 [Verrucomicrobia bacterium]|nr:hypothetical protein [Verrucomicrobiota bacterium]